MRAGPDPGGVICLSCGRGWPCPQSPLPGHVGAYASGRVIRTLPAISPAAAPRSLGRPRVPPQQHVCPVPQPGGPAVFCERCRIWRWQDSGARVISTVPEADGAQLLADNWELAARVAELERDLAAGRAELHPPPQAGTAQWWAQATGADLAPGAAACARCESAATMPDPGTGLCRFCADLVELLAAEECERAAEARETRVDTFRQEQHRRGFTAVAVLLLLSAVVVSALAWMPGPLPAAEVMVSAMMLAMLALGQQQPRG